MKKIVSLLFFALVLVSAQEYLPLDQLPWNTLVANNIGNSGTSEFWKVDKDGSSTIISAYPVRPNSITKVTFYLVNGNSFIIGCGKGGNLSTMPNTVVGYRPNSVGYRVPFGTKLINGDSDDYATPANAGDTVSMTIDLRPFKNTVAFAKNGIDMGIASMGLNYWGRDIYIMVNLWAKGGRIKVTNYEVTTWPARHDN